MDITKRMKELVSEKQIENVQELIDNSIYDEQIINSYEEVNPNFAYAELVSEVKLAINNDADLYNVYGEELDAIEENEVDQQLEESRERGISAENELER